jgi:hypothetical protein
MRSATPFLRGQDAHHPVAQWSQGSALWPQRLLEVVTLCASQQLQQTVPSTDGSPEPASTITVLTNWGRVAFPVTLPRK